MTNIKTDISYFVDRDMYDGKYKLTCKTYKYLPREIYSEYRYSKSIQKLPREVQSPTSRAEKYLMKIFETERQDSKKLEQALKVVSNIESTKANADYRSILTYKDGDEYKDIVEARDLTRNMFQKNQDVLKRLSDFSHYDPRDKAYILEKTDTRNLNNTLEDTKKEIIGKILDRTLTEQEYKKYDRTLLPEYSDIYEKEKDIQNIRKYRQINFPDEKLKLRERIACWLLR